MLESFSLMLSHYPEVDLLEVAKGFPMGYSDAELDSFEEAARPHVLALLSYTLLLVFSY